MPPWLMPAYGAVLLGLFVGYGWAVRSNRLEGRALVAVGTAIGVFATAASFVLLRWGSGGKLPVQAILVNSLGMALCTGFVIASGLRQQRVETIDSWQVGDTQLLVLHGAATRIPTADALIVPTSTRLVAYPGPSGAVVSAGGRSLESSLAKLAPAPLDKVVPTLPGNLPVASILHAAVHEPNKSVDSKRLQRGYGSAVVQARKSGAHSIVVAVGTLRGLTAEESVAAAFSCARHATSFEKIVWYALDPQVARAFTDFCSRRSGESALPTISGAETDA